MRKLGIYFGIIFTALVVWGAADRVTPTFSVVFKESGGANTVTMRPQAMSSNYAIDLPTAVPANNASPLLMSTTGVLSYGATLPTSCTAGGIVYGNGNGFACTTAGASGYIATSGGAGAPTWTSVLPLANGGTAKALTAINGGLVWSDADSMEITSAGTAQQWALSGGAGAPTFSNMTTTGKTIDWSADEIQLTVQAHSPQTSDLGVFESSAGTDYFKVEGDGQIVIGSGAATAGTILDIQSTTRSVLLPKISIRPTGVAGMGHYNSVLNAFEYFNGTEWVPYYSGTWTATMTNGSNVAATSWRNGEYTRLGSIVFWSMIFDVDATSAGVATVATVSFPIPSAITGATEAHGSCSTGDAAGSVVNYAIIADAANDRFQLYGQVGTTANISVACSGTYLLK